MSASRSDAGVTVMTGDSGRAQPWPVAISLLLHGMVAAALAAMSFTPVIAPAQPEPVPVALIIETAVPPAPAAGGAPAPAPSAETVAPVAAPAPVRPVRRVVAPTRPSALPVKNPVATATSPSIPSQPTSVPAEGGGSAAVAGQNVQAGQGGGGVGRGTGDGVGAASQAGDVIAAYLADVRARLQRGLRYPDKARRVGLQGAVYLRLRILADGSIAPDSVVVQGDAAHPLLVAGAMETVRTVPLKPPPLPVMDVVAPLQFRID